MGGKPRPSPKPLRNTPTSTKWMPKVFGEALTPELAQQKDRIRDKASRR
jgi:hypothetical protein